jgi:molybdopterin converting factor small subunit
MIDVRLYAHLAPQGGQPPAAACASAAPRSGEFQVAARPGLTVRDIVAEAGVRPEDVHFTMLNSVRVDLDAPLTDGDRLGLFPAVSGG